MSWEIPKDRNEARRVVWETVKVVRIQLNKALGCRLQQGDLDYVTDSVMHKLYPMKKSRKKK
jgi:hypothetical protein